MTEEEAKTKWCPFARVLVESDETRDHPRIAAANRLDIRGDAELDLGWKSPRCIGSACMAWRSASSNDDWVVTAKGERVTRKAATHFGWEEAPTGYCGLAGAPQ